STNSAPAGSATSRPRRRPHNKNGRRDVRLRTWEISMRHSAILVALLYSAFGPSFAPAQTSEKPPATIAEEPAPLLRGRVVAVGIPRASAIAEIGTFHPGGPIHDNPAFAEYTKPGNILDPSRLLVTSASNFGATKARPQDAEGAVLSLDPTGPATIVVPPGFAAAGDQVSTLDGRLKLFAAQSPRFRNG